MNGYYAIPRRALRTGPAMWVMHGDSTLSTAAVTVIQQIQDTVYVRSDVAPGVSIVVSDLTVMTEGMAVRRAEAAGPAGDER